MAIKEFRAGPSQVYPGISDKNTTLPALTTLTFTASADTPTTLERNSGRTALPTSTNIQVIVGLVGEDAGGGYSVTRCSPNSGTLTVTSGQTIKVKVLNADWPASFNKAAGVAVFLKFGSADEWQLAKVAPTDSTNDFVTAVLARPRLGAKKFTEALLQSVTATDTALGDRVPTGYDFPEVTPTTDNVVIRYSTENITFKPNNAGDFANPTARPVGVTFNGLINDLQTVSRAVAADYVEYTDSAVTFKESDQGFKTAVAIIKGNKPLKMLFPPDNSGNQEELLFMSLLLENTEEVALNWSKGDQTPVPFVYNQAPLDHLFDNQPTVYARLRSA